MLRGCAAALLAIALASPLFAQSTAANGSIEGTIVDSSGGVLPGVTVTITNVDTGAARAVVTNEAGIYRAPLLPLGTYRVVAELQGFKKFEESGIKLSVGQTATVNITLGIGAMNEVVSVSAEDKPALDIARIDIGHTMSDLEVHNLPLVARNPYNFALVQPGVTGYENVEFGVPRLAANGAAMRINYQIDGNTNTEKDRAGLRLLPMSEVMIQEVKVVTTGFAPEFGQTMGMVYNAVTPSGTNVFHGEGGYLFRRKPFSAFPFFFGCGSTTAATSCPPITAADSLKPDTRVDTGTADLGGPIIKDKLFFYAGWEQTRRDLSSTSLITVNPSIVQQVGVNAQPAASPNVQTAKFFIGKGDYQMTGANRFTLRYIRFHNDAPYNSGGGIQTLQQATNFLDAMDSAAGQLVSSFGNNQLNELRVQYAHRHQSSIANSDSGSGPSIQITGVIGFGGPWASTGQGNAGFDFKQNITQVVDNFTFIRGSHAFKVGGDWQHIYDERTNAPQFVYNFPSVNAYLSAANGINPYAYSSMSQITGNLSFNMSTNLYSLFVQDDWQLSSSVKILYGIRYDLYKYPQGLASAPLASTQSFNTDTNNFGPRLGVAWSLTPQTVVRASTGIMYDQAILGGYEQALQQSGSPRSPTYTYSATTAGAPAFPNGITTGTLAPQSPWTVDPGFQVGRTWQSNAQLERAFSNSLTAYAGFMYAKGNQLPVMLDTNLANPIGALPDGRPIFNTAASAATRIDPRFNHIFEVRSIGTSTYKALTLGMTKRFSKGLEVNLNYNLGKGIDDTPLVTQLTVQSEPGVSDPTNLGRDTGPNPLDMRHNFNGNFVYTSSSNAANGFVRGLMNGNQIGVLLQFNSGLPVNIRSNRDLNADSVLSDRPDYISRNSLYLPWRKNVDMRYTRDLPLRGTSRIQLIAELKNVFNTEQMAGINTVVVTDTAGNPVAAIPSDPFQFPNPSGYEQRKFQLGFKMRF